MKYKYYHRIQYVFIIILDTFTNAFIGIKIYTKYVDFTKCFKTISNSILFKLSAYSVKANLIWFGITIMGDSL